jgi:hypothetical protein
MRNIQKIVGIALTVALVLFIATACDEDESDSSGYPNCTPALEFFYDCGYYVTFDDVEPVGIMDAWDSCQSAYGQMWWEFMNCWRTLNSTCEEFAECLPEHGFHTILDDDSSQNESDDDSAQNESDDDSAL